VNRRRLWVVVAWLSVSLSIVIARAVQVMVVQHEMWSERARGQHEQVIKVPGPRGQILSADGYVLATSVDRVAVQLDTKVLSNPNLFVDAAASLLGSSEVELRKRIGRGSRGMWLAQRIHQREAEAIRALAPGAIVIVPDSQRIYPAGTVAAPVIGFVGREEMQTVGREGYEHHYDATLAGETRSFLAVNDAKNRRLRLKKLRNNDGGRGYDLELTLHARLQAACEAELQRTLDDYRAKAGSAVVLEARTGTILALVSLPSFDPAVPGKVSNPNWRLRPVQDAFEPGSVVKPMVASAALAAGVIRRGERFDCLNYGTRVAGRWLRDHAEPGTYTLDEVVAESANAGIIEVSERLRPEQLWGSFDGFGFGRKTGVGFPAESRGILPKIQSWSRLSHASLALGQELTATPLQVAMAYGAIANGGWLLQPRLVARVTGGGNSLDHRENCRSRVLDTKLCARLRRMLEAAVLEGTGNEAKVPGYRVAGKTGTAQRVVNGTFDDTHHVAWFAGFLPMPDPQIVVVVAVEDPSVDYWGATVAAPAFARIAEATVCYLGLPPTVPIPGGETV
jgi:cell division protein FtsI/penicillin-binding protein 2